MISWEQYSLRFRMAVAAADYRRRFDAAYAERCLAYARPLHKQGLPIIYDAEHLARLVGYDTGYLFGAANSSHKYYRTFYISKVAGWVAND